MRTEAKTKTKTKVSVKDKVAIALMSTGAIALAAALVFGRGGSRLTITAKKQSQELRANSKNVILGEFKLSASNKDIEVVSMPIKISVKRANIKENLITNIKIYTEDKNCAMVSTNHGSYGYYNAKKDAKYYCYNQTYGYGQMRLVKSFNGLSANYSRWSSPKTGHIMLYFGSPLIIPAGQSRTILVKADIGDNVSSREAIRVNIDSRNMNAYYTNGQKVLVSNLARYKWRNVVSGEKSDLRIEEVVINNRRKDKRYKKATVYVRNIGDADINSRNNKISVQVRANNKIIGQAYITSSIKAGAKSAYKLYFKLPDYGKYNVDFVVDSNNAIQETNESNNIYTVVIEEYNVSDNSCIAVPGGGFFSSATIVKIICGDKVSRAEYQWSNESHPHRINNRTADIIYAADANKVLKISGTYKYRSWFRTRYKEFEKKLEFNSVTKKNNDVIYNQINLSPPIELPVANFQSTSSRIDYKDALNFNSKKNSGWVYIARTIPDNNGQTFWVAAVRSLSTKITDTSAQLLFGIANTKTGTYHPGFLDGGSLSEDPNKIDVTYVKDGKTLLKLQQTKTNLSEFKLEVSLPLLGDYYQATEILDLKRPILYEGGDGVIPVGNGIDSLYVSLVTEQGFWIDFQKFDIQGSFSPASLLKSPNHRWMSFILDKPIGILPAGTIGVGWEILDKNNQRQKGGYTNVDLLIPGKPQVVATESQINSLNIHKIATWKSEHKTYLKKWKVNYYGVELLFETLIPNQENEIMNNFFYEGATKVMNPQTGEQVGTGMLEQTHSEISS